MTDVRHLIYFGFILASRRPSMSAGRLLFAAATKVYILLGICFEGRDLVDLFSQRYRDCRVHIVSSRQALPIRTDDP